MSLSTKRPPDQCGGAGFSLLVNRSRQAGRPGSALVGVPWRRFDDVSVVDGCDESSNECTI